MLAVVSQRLFVLSLHNSLDNAQHGNDGDCPALGTILSDSRLLQ